MANSRAKVKQADITRVVDRHGKVRWLVRHKGKSGYLRGPYGSAEWRSECRFGEIRQFHRYDLDDYASKLAKDKPEGESCREADEAFGP